MCFSETSANILMYRVFQLRKIKVINIHLASSSSDAFILIELTFPWEDKIEVSNVLKTEKCSDLAKDVEDSGFRIKLILVEVGARALVGKSACF